MEVQRTEQKIILTKAEALLLQKRLAAIMPLDSYCIHGKGYEIRSLYFDTLADRSFVEKADGLLVHEKIRARIYGSGDQVIKLETKRKVGDAQTKRSLVIRRDTLDQLSRGQYQGLLSYDDPLALYFYQKLSRGMMPKSIVQYKRLSYCILVNNTRITFDYDIRATESCFDLYREPLLTHPILPSDKVILEVKFNNFLLGYIKDALNTLHKSTASFSKYANGRSFYRSMI